jgi:hypothetical protein
MKYTPRRKSLKLSVVSFAIAALLSITPLLGQTSTFLSFDAPGAGTGIGQGTFPVAINAGGVIAGWYFDSSFVSHGFVRHANGGFTEFSPPNLSQVFVYGINNKGQILGNGNLTVSPFSRVGFIRDPNGIYTIISVAGATNFVATSINSTGEVTGYYFDANNRWNGFFRDATGNLTVFQDPNATTASGNGTYAWIINDKGMTGGFYNYNNLTGINRAFVRDRLGNFRNFDAVSGGSTLIQPMGMNLNGEIAGYYGDAETLITHCFLRDASGTVTDFDIPGAFTSLATGINNDGVIVGYWMEGNQITVDSFVRDNSGNITTFAAPDNNLGTFSVGINRTGQIVGNWQDSVSLVNHGFIETNGQ